VCSLETLLDWAERDERDEPPDPGPGHLSTDRRSPQDTTGERTDGTRPAVGDSPKLTAGGDGANGNRGAEF